MGGRVPALFGVVALALAALFERHVLVLGLGVRVGESTIWIGSG